MAAKIHRKSRIYQHQQTDHASKRDQRYLCSLILLTLLSHLILFVIVEIFHPLLPASPPAASLVCIKSNLWRISLQRLALHTSAGFFL